MSKARYVWNEFWFKPASSFDLGLGRLVFYTLLSFYYFERFDGHSLTQWAGVSDQFWEPVSFFKVLPFLHTHSVGVLDTMSAGWQVALFLSAIGFYTRWSTKACALFALFCIGYPENFGKIHHADHMATMVQCLLAFSHCGDSFSVDALLRKKKRASRSAEYSWPLRWIQAILMLSYFEAAYQKMTISGLEWVFSDNLANTMLAWGNPRGVYVATHFPLACRIMAGWTVLAEGFGLLSLFSYRAALVFVPAIFLFHVGSRVTIGNAVAFTPLMMCYIFWVPWEKLWTKLRSLK